MKNSTKSKAEIVLKCSARLDGYIIVLDEGTRRELESEGISVRHIGSLYISFDTKEDYENTIGNVWEPIASVLTSLSDEEVAQRGLAVVDSLTGKKIYPNIKNTRKRSALHANS